MKNFISILFLLLAIGLSSVTAQIVNIPDWNFKNALMAQNCADFNDDGTYDGDVDTNDNFEIEVSEAQAVMRLYVSGEVLTDLIGIQSFSGLKRLDCSGNEIASLDLQGLTNLQTLNCNNSQVTSLNLQGLTSLQNLQCRNNRITNLNLQGLISLVEMNCSTPVTPGQVFNSLANLNLQGLTNLRYLYCSNCQITSIDLQGLTNLYYLDCSDNQLTSINVSGLIYLQSLSCSDNHLTNLNVQGLTNLSILHCYTNQLVSLNLQNLVYLRDLRCHTNQLIALNIQGLSNLQYLDCIRNHLTSIDLQGLNNLSTLNCGYNPISCLSFLPQSLTNLSISTNAPITCLPNIPPNLQTTLPLCQPNNPNGCLFAARIYGKAYQDLNNNCTPDANDILQKNLLIQARNTATQEVFTTNSNASGFYEMGLPTPATYEVKTIILNNNYWQSCAAQTIFLAADTVQVQRDMLIKPVVQCADVEVNHQLANVARPCSTAVYKVSSFNAGTITATGLSAKITLPTELTMQTATYPFTDLGGGVYQFALPNVGALERDTFSFSAAVSCTAVMNQMLCTNVAITPNTYCIGGGLAGWDGSDIELSGRCIGSDSIRFMIKNVGQGGMSTGRNYGVIEDMVMIRGNAFQLAAGASDSITVAAEPSRIYRIIADEAPNNPTGTVQEQFMVWGCGGISSQIHWGFVNNFGLNNGTSNPHQLCEAVRTSFDPNDISAKAEGVGTQRFILKNSDIEYKIRFQNTGNDTAFVVRLLDKLPNELDASTLRIGTGSHPFTWRLASNGVLEFLFQNIRLVDSMTNEPASHGFITYRIKTKPNLANGTTISNQAGIYFDYNAPVMTNIYTHTIGENLGTILFTTPQIVDNQYFVKIFPNPIQDEATLEISCRHLKGIGNVNENLNFILYNTLGQTVKNQTFAGQTLTLTRNGLPQGVYFYSIIQGGKIVARGKVEVAN